MDYERSVVYSVPSSVFRRRIMAAVGAYFLVIVMVVFVANMDSQPGNMYVDKSRAPLLLTGQMRECECERQNGGEKECLWYTISRSDGFGGQMQGYMSVIAYARRHADKVCYLHTPFQAMEHPYPEELTLSEWAEEMEEFGGIGAGEVLSPPAGRSVATLEHLHPQIEKPDLIDKYYTAELRAELRARYDAAPMAMYGHGQTRVLKVAPKTHTDEFARDVAGHAVIIGMHVRRGDALVFRFRRSSPDETHVCLARAIRHANEHFPRRGVAVHIYSDATADDFAMFIRRFEEDAGLSPHVHFHMHLGGDPRPAFHDMVHADILVTGRSSFSTAAALLAVNATVVHQSFYHKPLARWIHC